MIEVITRAGFACPWCDRVKTLLRINGKSFTAKELTLEELKQRGFATVPQVFDGEKLIGGFEATLAHLDFGGF